ncbi:MAG TPA: GAF domain-containing protein, partial [Dehalococcoidia bacterium]|nr:GAF domain-containing protein [Dehalococcoidia bacterium]
MTIEARKRPSPALDYLPLHELTHAVAAAQDLKGIYAAALAALQRSLNVNCSSILLFDPDGVMRFKYWLNLSDGYRRAVEGHTPWTPETEDPQPVLVPDVRKEPSLASLAQTIEDEGIRGLAFIPLVADHRLLGKFMLYYPEPHEFSDEEILLAQMAASQVAFAIDQHRVRKTLRESGQQYSELVQALAQAVYTTDAEGRIQLFNEAAAELWGRRPEIGKDLWCGSWRIFRADGEPMPLDECPMAVTLRENRPVRGEEILVERPNGERVWVAPYPTPLRNDAGDLVGAVNVLVDITDRKLAENELLAAAALKDQFLGLVSHELRTPISTVVGNALILLRRGDVLSEQDRRQALEDIAEEGGKLQRVIEDLLLLTRMETSEGSDLEPVGLLEVVEGEIDTFSRRRPNREVDLSFDDDLPVVRGQRALLSMAFGNLINNADKYSTRDTEIAISLRRADDGAVEVRVRDRGIGIAQQDLPKLF